MKAIQNLRDYINEGKSLDKLDLSNTYVDFQQLCNTPNKYITSISYSKTTTNDQKLYKVIFEDNTNVEIADIFIKTLITY